MNPPTVTPAAHDAAAQARATDDDAPADGNEQAVEAKAIDAAQAAIGPLTRQIRRLSDARDDRGSTAGGTALSDGDLEELIGLLEQGVGVTRTHAGIFRGYMYFGDFWYPALVLVRRTHGQLVDRVSPDQMGRTVDAIVEALSFIRKPGIDVHKRAVEALSALLAAGDTAALSERAVQTSHRFDERTVDTVLRVVGRAQR